MAGRGQINWPALLLLPIATPLAILGGLFGTKKACTAEDVAAYLRNALADTGGERDWDDFTSIPITDPSLDQVRMEAEMVSLPVDDARRATLEELLRRAEALSQAAQPQTTSS